MECVGSALKSVETLFAHSPRPTLAQMPACVIGALLGSCSALSSFSIPCALHFSCSSQRGLVNLCVGIAKVRAGEAQNKALGLPTVYLLPPLSPQFIRMMTHGSSTAVSRMEPLAKTTFPSRLSTKLQGRPLIDPATDAGLLRRH